MTHVPSQSEMLSRLDRRSMDLLRYWDGLRGHRPVPGRVEINPTDISAFLSRVCILERPRAGTVRIRLAGATLSSRMGMELRGMPFRSLFELSDRAAAMDAAETAIVTPAISVMSLARADRLDVQPEAQMLILPLSDPRGGLTRAIALYSELSSVTPCVADLRGRFQAADRFDLDIPEHGPLEGLADAIGNPEFIPQIRSTPRPISKSRTAAVARAAPPTNARVAAKTLEHHSRPVFQVIDGGRA